MILPDTTRVAALFDRREDADAARQELIDNGFNAEEIRLVDRSENIQGREEQGGFWHNLREMFGKQDADTYAEAARHSSSVLSVDARGEDRANEAADILDRHHPVDLDERVAEQRRQGAGTQAGSTGSTQAGSAEGASFASSETPPQSQQPQAGRKEGEERIPIVEEHLDVGKRRHRAGGVRIYSRVEEQPVEEDVTLREERIKVDREKADRPADADAFEERTIEASETREEPVVEKEARVVEDVVLRKEQEEHTETVHDTVRKTDVDIEQLDQDYRQNFESSYADTGETYDQYSPAYEYGRQLAVDPHYGNRDWESVEPEARERFEQDNPGTWDKFRDSVRYGYERALGRR
ncbi:MAG: YsnF/AvaK domain-containing protein [Phycisphaeraceae bacterium]